MLNKIQIIGNLGAAPELRYTQSGEPVATFNVCTNRRWTDKSGEDQDEATWHRVVVWGKQGENVNKYLAKGRRVFVEGRMRYGSYQKEDGSERHYAEVVAYNVIFLDRAGDRPPHPADVPGNSKDGGGDAGIPDPDFDEDIPF